MSLAPSLSANYAVKLDLCEAKSLRLHLTFAVMSKARTASIIQAVQGIGVNCHDGADDFGRAITRGREERLSMRQRFTTAKTSKLYLI